MKKIMKTMSMLFFLVLSISLGNVLAVQAAEATLQPAVISTGAEDISTLPNYTYTIPAYTSNSLKDTQCTIVPITVTSPGAFYISVNSSQLVYNVQVSFWTDANCTFKAATSNSFSIVAAEKTTEYINFNNAGTYYMCMRYSIYSSKSVAGTINMTPYFIPRGTMDLPANTWKAVAPGEFGDDHLTYYRVTIAKAGYIGITQNNPNAKNLSVDLCKDNTVSSIASKYIEPNTTTWYPVTAGTYYIKTEGIYQTNASLQWQFTENFTAKQNTTFTITPMADKTDFDVKIKAEKTGLLTLSIANSENAYITFLNSKKRAISDSLWTWGTTSSVSVEKGKTYYIRVNTYSGDDARTMAYTIASVSKGKNTSKGKAINLKAKKTNKSLIAAGDTKWHYYKFTLKKSKKLSMTFKVEGNGKFKYQLLKGSKSIYVSHSSSKGTLTTYSKLSKGTYYLRVKMADKKSSGRVTVKLK